MKNQDNKKRTRKSRDDNSSQLNSLDSQLGTFGLEPPKRYRPDQELLYDKQQNKQRKASAINNKLKKRKISDDRILTPDEKRKQQSKKRKKKKLMRRIVYSALLIIAIIAVLIVLSLTVLFKIDTIKIVGCESYTNKEITAVLPIENDDNLFIADTKSAADKLTENLPYIYRAEIKRKLPSTIVVNITEVDRIYAVVNADKTYTLLDKDMKVLEQDVIKRPKGSVVIKKLEFAGDTVGRIADFSDEQQKADILALTEIIDEMKLDEITAIYSEDINNNYMTYDKRITYKLGTTENLKSKVYSALAATEKLNETDPDAQGEMTVSSGKQIYFTKK